MTIRKTITTLGMIAAGIGVAYQLMFEAALPLYASEPVGNTLEEEVSGNQTKDGAEKVMVFKEARDIFETYDNILKMLKFEIVYDESRDPMLIRRFLKTDESKYVLRGTRNSYVFIISYLPDRLGELRVEFLMDARVLGERDGIELVPHQSHPLFKDNQRTIVLLCYPETFPFDKNEVMDEYRTLSQNIIKSEDERVAQLLYNLMHRKDRFRHSAWQNILEIDLVGLYPPKFTDSPLRSGNLNEDLEELERQIELLKNQHSQTMTPETEAMTQEAK